MSNRNATTNTLEGLAAQIANRAVLIPDLGEALEDLETHKLFDAILGRLEKESGQRKSLRDEVQLFEQLQDALPENMKRQLVEFSDLKDRQEALQRDAAYLVGVAVGQRLGGVR